jgi:hypothetical protein
MVATQERPTIEVSGYRAEFVEVTPAMATEWLDGPKKNRIFSERRALKYTRMMQQELWVFNGEPIRFCDDSSLIDGQHRLWAIRRSGDAQLCLVLHGLPEAALLVTDRGAAKTLGDFLSVRGEVSTTVLAAAVRHYSSYYQFREFRVGRDAVREAIQEFLDLLDANPGLRDAVKDGQRLYHVLPIGGKGFWAAVCYVMTSLDRPDAEFFIASLISGVGLEEKNPIRVLRERLVRVRAQATGMHRVLSTRDIAALTFKAWNFFRAGDLVSVVSYRAGGADPEKFPIPG